MHSQAVARDQVAGIADVEDERTIHGLEPGHARLLRTVDARDHRKVVRGKDRERERVRNSLTRLSRIGGNAQVGRGQAQVGMAA